MPTEKIETKEQQAIKELAYLVSELADVLNDIGGPGFGSTVEHIKKRAWEIINPKND